MSYYWIDVGHIKSVSGGSETQSEREKFEQIWSDVVGQEYILSSVSYQYEEDGEEKSSFVEVPYPLTEDEADEILERVASGDLAYCSSEFSKKLYDLEGFVSTKERKGEVISGTVSHSLDELRERK